MDVKEARQAALQLLLDEDIGPERGRKSRLAARIGKSPAQISQWISGYRSIEEETAREIERAAGKPPRWMDRVDDEAHAAEPNTLSGSSPATAAPDLASAVTVVLGALATIPALRWAAVQATLAQVVGRPEMRDDVATELLALLSGPPAKHRPAA